LEESNLSLSILAFVIEPFLYPNSQDRATSTAKNHHPVAGFHIDTY
jgi:hypothetical protein